VFARGSASSPNCAGWPNDPNFDDINYWPDHLRIWTR
jgi:hypothetical protein